MFIITNPICSDVHEKSWSELPQVLREAPAFQKLSTKEIVRLSNNCTIQSFKRGASIFKATSNLDKVWQTTATDMWNTYIRVGLKDSWSEISVFVGWAMLLGVYRARGAGACQLGCNTRESCNRERSYRWWNHGIPEPIGSSWGSFALEWWIYQFL